MPPEEVSLRNFLWRHSTKTFNRRHHQRSLVEVTYKGVLRKSSVQVSPEDFLWRSPTQAFYRDLHYSSTAKVSCGGLMQSSPVEVAYRDVLRRNPAKILGGGLLSRCPIPVDVSCGCVMQRSH